jgi:hypothetical protein
MRGLAKRFLITVDGCMGCVNIQMKKAPDYQGLE